jgi:hypothetical protein
MKKASKDFQNWFDELGTVRQDELLGADKAELFRNGKLNVRNLLNQKARPLSLEELRRMHGVDTNDGVTPSTRS